MTKMLSQTPILLSIFSDAQNIISIITSIVDIFAIVVVAVTFFTSTFPLIKSAAALSLPFLIKSTTDRRKTTEENYLLRRRAAKENFIKGLLLALELESANAILKIGVFTSSLVGISTTSSTSTFNISNFIFFVGIFSVRIAINQTLRRSI
jgi:hypothetical protein